MMTIKKQIVCASLFALSSIFLSGNSILAQSPIPPAYTSPVVNYVRSWDALRPTQDINGMLNYGTLDVRMSTQYLDGLGRPIQAVLKEGSMATGSAATDVVSTNIYDGYGREAIKYLPYPDASNNGAFKTNPFNPQVGFYNTQLSGQTGETTGNNTTPNWAYAQTNFEPSPLNRPQEAFAPGVSWVGSSVQTLESSRKSLKTKYWANSANDSVRIWNVTNAGLGSFGSYNTSTIYTAGQLYKTVVLDEQNNQLVEFKDKQGKLILKKIQMNGSADTGTGAGHAGWLCTYYIYDELANLRCVIQPEGVKALNASSWNFNGTLLAEQCFRYEYDHRNQIIIKKVPGQSHIDMIYDNRDRLVMTQDQNQRSAVPIQWSYIEYDLLDRPVKTGEFEWNTDAQNFRNFARLFSDYPWNHFVSSGITPLILTVTHYDDYNDLPAPLSAYLSSWSSHFSTATTTWPYPQTPTVNTATKGMITWTSTRILGSSNFLHAVNYFDEKGRVIQVQSSNASGGVDVTSTQYTWAGLPYFVVQKQQNSNGAAQTAEIITKNSYDILSRPIKIEKKIRHSLISSNAWSDNNSFKTIAEIEYDKLGQLKKKKLAPGYNSNNGLENLIYDYNIRGWMLGMNRWYTRDEIAPPNTPSGSGYFGFDLGYDKKNNVLINNKSYADVQYNGNITGMAWKSRGDAEKRKYDFVYDPANRLLKADFKQYTGGDFSQDAGVNFDIKMGDGSNPLSAYDDNGNIKRMQQWGLLLTNSAKIDDLTYNYEVSPGQLSNKLFRVMDDVTADNKLGDFYNGTSGTNIDYTYDVNGNLTSDLNKNITSITYNHLNLPSVITLTGSRSITYTYDATGNKLKKTAQENNATVNVGGTDYTCNIITTTWYFAGSLYETKEYINSTQAQTAYGYTNRLQFISHEEGRIRFVPANVNICPSPLADRLIYDYFIKDHLGNIRTILTEQKENICYIAATSETSRYSDEKKIYDIVDTRRIDKTLTGATQSSFENKLYRTHGGNTNERNGLGAVLKVMSGDNVKIYAESYYNLPGGNAGAPVSFTLTELFNSLVGSAAVTGTKGIIDPSTINTISGSSILSFLNTNNNSTGTNTADAFVCWILFDEQFKFVVGGADPVQPGGGYKEHTNFTTNPVNITKNGFLYVYVSNQSNLPVYFDNLAITHTAGPVAEENHYYPFGLTMSGISSRGFTATENKRKYNGIEFENTFSLNIGETFFRTHDPQIGRWYQIDPKPNEMYSSYSAMNNNPVSSSDPLGDTAIVRWGKRKEARFVNGQWIDSKTRQAVDVSKASKSAQRIMNDYQKMNADTDFDEMTAKINTSATNVVLVNGKTASTDPNSRFREGKSNEIKVVLSETHKTSEDLNHGRQKVILPSIGVMSHELGHAFELLTKGRNSENFLGSDDKLVIPGWGTIRSINLAKTEINAMYWENIMRHKLNLPIRELYGWIDGVSIGNNFAIIQTDKKGNVISVGDLDGRIYKFK